MGPIHIHIYPFTYLSISFTHLSPCSFSYLSMYPSVIIHHHLCIHPPVYTGHFYVLDNILEAETHQRTSQTHSLTLQCLLTGRADRKPANKGSVGTVC